MLASGKYFITAFISLSIASGFCENKQSSAQETVLPHSGGDIREFRVGLAVDELPTTGYRRFACGQNGSPPVTLLEGWQDYKVCPADQDGLHEVAFEYDNDYALESIEGTGVAGHPVLISLLFTSGGAVEAIRIFSDPMANSYNKRRAYILARIAKQRFGWLDWECIDRPNEAGESEIAGIMHKDHCTKELGDRTITVQMSFYRLHGEIINKAFLEIKRNPS